MPQPAPDSTVHTRMGWRKPLRTSGLLSMLGVCLASPLAVVTLLGASAATGQPAAFGVPPGASDDGRAVPVGPALAQAGAGHGLQLRRGCRWGQPGRMPYQGTTRQALLAAGLPEDVVTQIDSQRSAGQKTGRLVITRDAIRHTGDGRVFPARGLALTFGMTLCRDASVNFAKGHEELADLYEARDAQGRAYAVMVPDVCGNVTVLGTQGGRGMVAGAAATLARRAQALAALADAMDPPAAGTPAAAPAGAGSGDGPGDGAPHPGAAGAAAAGGGGDGDGAAASAADAADAAASGAAGGAGSAASSAGDAERAAVPRRRQAGAGDAGGSAGTDSGVGVASGGLPGTSTGAATGGAGPAEVPARPVPAALAAVGAVTGLLVPADAAAGVVRKIGRVTASAGQGLEALAGTLGAATPPSGSAGAGTQQVPEPGTLWLALLALVGLGLGLARRR